MSGVRHDGAPEISVFVPAFGMTVVSRCSSVSALPGRSRQGHARTAGSSVFAAGHNTFRWSGAVRGAHRKNRVNIRGFRLWGWFR
jgi:hypothetical protein